MKKRIRSLFVALATMISTVQAQSPLKPTFAAVANGILQGSVDSCGIRSFKGIPFAQPPIGALRWKEPQPPKNWRGIRLADHFGPRPMQRKLYNDMYFRSMEDSEDCLYLNVWTPAKQAMRKLPVLVYFYGGGFMAGDGSEYRYDGESLAQKGIVTVTVNYRLGVFGLLALPELTNESARHASGNYGLMDQHAALLWVQKNIATFGGDPAKVTIAGESAGAMSVCAQMASPLSKGLFIGAIAESGSMLGNLSPVTLKEAEEEGLKFKQKTGALSLAVLRKMPADQLLELSANAHFPVNVDGYFLPETPQNIFSKGRQMDVPLLAGWNSAEVDYHFLLNKLEPTVANYQKVVDSLYGNRADEILKQYPAPTDAAVEQVATELAADRFIAYATWKFIDLHGKTDGYFVYRYLFSRKRPPLKGEETNDYRFGAPHASEIEYALGNLYLDKNYNWTPGDFKTSAVMEDFFANFIKTGNPNGDNLPKWYGLQSSVPKVMIIDSVSKSMPEKKLERYVLLDSFFNN